MADPANTGIYEIVNLVNGKRYIGGSVDIRQRWREHKSGLSRGRHHSKALQRAWNKYGGDAFAFRILALCTRDALEATEQHTLNEQKPEYNTCKVVRTMQGVSPSAETRAKISAAFANRYFSPETRAKISAALKGRVRPPEVGQKIAAANRGRKASDEARANLRTARAGRSPALGSKWTAEQRATHSEMLKANPTFLGRKHSPETKAKISAARRARIAAS